MFIFNYKWRENVNFPKIFLDKTVKGKKYGLLYPNTVPLKLNLFLVFHW